jgi:hypothetical protein
MDFEKFSAPEIDEKLKTLRLLHRAARPFLRQDKEEQS